MGNYVISISREFGSGGRLIGKRLAAALGIPCYDRTIIQKTSEKSGLSPDFIARAEERARSRFHLSIAPVGVGVPALAHQGVPVSHQAFFAQSEVIRELADEGPCVIVGRCADYILRDKPGLIRVFISADYENRIQRICHRDGVTEKEAEENMRKMDKARASYYSFHTDRKWNDASNYDLCINSSRKGIDTAVEQILQFIKA